MKIAPAPSTLDQPSQHCPRFFSTQALDEQSAFPRHRGLQLRPLAVLEQPLADPQCRLRVALQLPRQRAGLATPFDVERAQTEASRSRAAIPPLETAAAIRQALGDTGLLS